MARTIGKRRIRNKQVKKRRATARRRQVGVPFDNVQALSGIAIALPIASTVPILAAKL